MTQIQAFRRTNQVTIKDRVSKKPSRPFSKLAESCHDVLATCFVVFLGSQDLLQFRVMVRKDTEEVWLERFSSFRWPLLRLRAQNKSLQRSVRRANKYNHRLR